MQNVYKQTEALTEQANNQVEETIRQAQITKEIASQSAKSSKKLEHMEKSATEKKINYQQTISTLKEDMSNLNKTMQSFVQGMSPFQQQTVTAVNDLYQSRTKIAEQGKTQNDIVTQEEPAFDGFRPLKLLNDAPTSNWDRR
jgi:chromosome segregation ATPase